MHRTLCAFVIIGCGGSSGTPPPTDTATDTAVVADAGPCGADTSFTGEYIDWDSTTTTFCGIYKATWQVHGDPTRQSITPPNGRFQLCVPSGAVTRVDIIPPTGASGCLSAPGSYAAPGIAVADPAAIARGGVFSARAYTTARRDAFFTAAGLVYDATKAQIVVHLATAATVSSAATHDATQAWSGTAWSASANGLDVFLPNVTIPAGGTTSVSVAGGRTVTVPVAADTITYVTP